MLMTGAKKGRKGKFWTELAWSRVVNWGRDLLALGDYLSKNVLESLGVDRAQMVPMRMRVPARMKMPIKARGPLRPA
jgi:hypothetical protein